MIANLVEPRIGKLILNHLIRINCPELRNGLLDSYFSKKNLGSDCLELFFWVISLNPSQLSNITKIPVPFSRTLYLNLTLKLSFEPRIRMFISNAYYTKRTRS